jgi:urease subunit gamma
MPGSGWTFRVRSSGSEPVLFRDALAGSHTAKFSLEESQMHLTPREIEKVLIYSLAEVALKRKAKGLKLNHPETVAIISATAMDGAREGKTLEEVMKTAASALTRNDVMEGVAEMIPFVQIEAVFTDGSRLITVHDPIK